LPYVNFIALNYVEQEKQICEVNLTDRDNMKADFSMCYVLREFPNFLIVLIRSFLDIFKEMLRNY
jgi:hypothetical protein